VADAEGDRRLCDFGPCQIESVVDRTRMPWFRIDTCRIPVLVSAAATGRRPKGMMPLGIALSTPASLKLTSYREMAD